MSISKNKSFYILSFGILLNISAYIGVLNLQSSINIDHNLGSLGASIMYVSAMIVCICVTPVLLKTIGAKWTLIISEAAFIPYIIMNVHPALYSVIPCAIIASFGDGLVWSASICYLTQLVRKYWESKCDESNPGRTLDEERNRWFGHFYGILKTSLIFGNLISYGVLYGARDLGASLNETNCHQDISHCGSSYTIKQNNTCLHKYVPNSKISIYLLIALYVVMQTTAVFIHIFFLPKIKLTKEDRGERAPIVILFGTIKATFLQAVSLYQLLLTPICFYFGIVVSYGFSSFTAGFVSCTIGVQQVGLVMVAYGCFNGLAALGVGKISQRFGISPIYLIGLCFDTCSLVLQLLWKPTLSDRFWVYGIACLLGVTDGIWQTATAATITSVYADSTELAVSVMEMWITLGMFSGFLLSGRIIISTQIYLLMGFLYLGCIGYAISYCKRKQNSKDKEERKTLVPK